MNLRGRHREVVGCGWSMNELDAVPARCPALTEIGRTVIGMATLDIRGINGAVEVIDCVLKPQDWRLDRVRSDP